MKKTIVTLAAIAGMLLAGQTVFGDHHLPAPSNGIRLPKEYKSWPVISSSYRTDNDTMRIIIGNDKAIEAARSGETNPWPEGAMLGKLIWKSSQDPNWESATVPGEFVHSEFMVKDKKKYPDTNGWGYARWKGMGQVPHMEAESCHECHAAVEENDFVFTHPVKLP